MAGARNPARSRPLSKNVKRLMKMARESPDNPNVIKAARQLAEKDYAYCDMQGEIFMAALDLGYALSDFTPVYMNSQLAGVIDYSFSAMGGMENDRLAEWLQIPLLIKAPAKIAALTMWLDEVSGNISAEEPATLTLAKLCEEAVMDEGNASGEENTADAIHETRTLQSLEAEYEYAYWLGYIYRCECLLHVESSRMVYGAFPETFMRETYLQMMTSTEAYDIEKTASEICRRLDMLLVGKLWNEDKQGGKKKKKEATKAAVAVADN